MIRSTGSAKRTRANGRPVVISKADTAAHKVIGDLQIIVVRTIQIGQVNGGRIGKGQVADRIKLGQDNHSASIADLRLHRRGGIGGNEERSKRAQEARGGDVKLGFEFIEVLVAALAWREVHEVPGKERVGQGQVGVDARGRKRIAVQVNAFFEITALGDAPTARDGMMTNVGEEQKVAVPVMQTLTKVESRAMQGVDQAQLP